MCLSSRHSWFCARCPSQGGLHNYGTATVSACQFNSNSANAGGGFFNKGAGGSGTATLSDCNFTSNLASGNGAGVCNIGTATLSDCQLTSNLASSNGGGLYSSNSAILSGCSLISNSASSNGGGFYNDGTSTLTDCQFISNSAPEASIVYANGVSTTAFFSCSFVGDYGDDECAVVTYVYVDDLAQTRASDLEFYYTQAFPNGTVCSAGTNMIIAYNNDVPMPFASADSADLLSCQYESIGVYCAFDCAAGLGGVGIECR